MWTKNQIFKMTYFFTEKQFGINQVVYTQGEPSDFIYIIKEGVFEATRSKIKKADPKTEQHCLSLLGNHGTATHIKYALN